MAQDYHLAALARQIDEELRTLQLDGRRENAPSRGGRSIPTEFRIGRAVALIGELSAELESLLNPLIDEWLLNDGSVTRLSELTGISRPTLTRRKSRVVRAASESGESNDVKK